MTDEHYLFDEVATDAELARLRLHEQWLDPLSQRYLARVGATEGMRCLDVGAGAGSVARWLSQQVGPTGRVVAVDQDTKFLVDLDATVEVRRLNILTDEVEENAFDLIHTRTLLGHLSNPRAGLERMVRALAPGGILLSLDDDLGLVSLAGHPEANLATELFHRWFETLKSLEIVDSCLGRTVPGLLAEVGLQDVTAEGTTLVSRRGDVVHEDHRRAFASVREMVVAKGFDGDAWDRAVALFEDDEIIYVGTTMFASWGRKAF